MVENIIKEWLKETFGWLNLNGLGLTEWPEALKGKEHLIVKLNCSDNQLTFLPELPNCMWLHCINNQLTRLVSSGSTSLSNCEELWCFNNQLTSIPALPGCFELICFNNKLTSLLALPKCVVLVCYNNKLFSTNLFDWKKIWKLKSSIYRTQGIKKFIRILKLRLYLPRLTLLKEELMYSPNHPGKFYKEHRLGKLWVDKKNKNERKYNNNFSDL